MRLAETYHFHWMFYDVMAQPEMRDMFQRRIDYDRWVRGKFKWPIPIRDSKYCNFGNSICLPKAFIEHGIMMSRPKWGM